MRDRPQLTPIKSRLDLPIQLSKETKPNRHPFVFSCAKDVAAAARLRNPRILSFGCSTGEEPHTLATLYFETARILGVDINPDVIAAARASYGRDPRLQFEVADSHPLTPASFDMIFAMSVLCRWPATRDMDDIADLYPFDAYERHVAHLDSLLRPGGIMVIFNPSYSFLLSRVSLGYDLVTDPRLARNGIVKRFQRNGRAYPAPATGGTDCIYLKHAAGAVPDPTRLTLRDATLAPVGHIERGLASD